MIQIQVRKLNETYIKVFADIQVETEIKEHFTFMAPGYQFSPKYKARIWDGKISLYNIKTKLLPIGLYPHLVDYAKSSGAELCFVPDEHFTEAMPKTDISINEIQEYINDLNLWDKAGPITARSYQMEAIHKAIESKRITLISPTSSGKSLIIYCIIRWLLQEDPDCRILLLVPSVMLVNQMVGDFQTYSSKNNWDVNKHCQKLYSGQSKDLSKRVLVTTWQSFTNIAKDVVAGPKLLSLYRAVIADEAHGAKGKEMQGILEKCVHAAYRIGTTGTIDTKPDAKVNVLQIEGFLGPLHKVITTKELMDSNQVSQLVIKALVLKYSQDTCKLMKTAEYTQEVDWLIQNEQRNQLLAKIALSTDGTTLLMVRNRDTHAKKLYERLKAVSTRPVYYVSGTVKVEERDHIRQLANIENCIIVATFATFSTGVNIPNLRHVIFGSPSKSSIQVLQSIGRGLRLHADKSHMVLWDVIDDMRFKKNENFAYTHGIERIAIYRKENFEIRIKELPTIMG